MGKIRDIVRSVLREHYWKQTGWGRDLPGADPFSPAALGLGYMPENESSLDDVDGSSKIKVKLGKKQTDFLTNIPEDGMGYKIVDVKLKSGKVLKGKTVLNSMYLQLDKSEVLKPDEIETITPHS